MQKSRKLKRNYWLDILKIVACLLVVVNHSSSILIKYTNYTKISVYVYSYMFAICKIGVPLFIMCTGYLLLSKKNTYKQIIKRIIRIIIPLFAMSFLYYYINNGHLEFNVISFLKKFIGEPMDIYLWYLYMLIGLYLVIPFIQKMINKFEKKDYIIFIILFLLIPGIVKLLSVYLKISISEFFSIGTFPIIIGYLVAGVYLTKIKLNKSYLIISIVSFVVFIVIFANSFYAFYFNNYISPYMLDSVFYITVSVPSLSVFYIFRYLFENKKINLTSCKIIEEISLTTFGIYLIHQLFIYKIYNMYIIQNIFKTSAYLGILILPIVIFIVCSIIMFIVRKIPFAKKFL